MTITGSLHLQYILAFHFEPTESMSSMVSANSGMACRVESTLLASTARNLLGETGSCDGGRCGRSSPCQDGLSTRSSRLAPVVSMSSDQTLYGPRHWEGGARSCG